MARPPFPKRMDATNEPEAARGLAEVREPAPSAASVDAPSPDLPGAPHTAALARALLAAVPDAAVFVVDHDLRYQYAEGPALATAGFTPDAFVGRTPADVLEPALAAEYVPRYRQALAGAPFEAEHAAHGHVYRSRGVPLRDAAGRTTAALAVSVDVTVQRAAEAALRASEARQAYLLALSDALRPLADVAEIQATATRVLGEHLGASRVAYVEIDGDEYVVTRDYVHGIPSMAGRYPVAAFGPGKLEEYRRGETRVVNDVHADPHNGAPATENFAAVQVRAGIGVPLVKHGEFVANLVVHMHVPRRWTPDEVALVEETAERTWAALLHARAEERLRASEAKYRVLFETMGQGYCELELVRDADGRAVDQRYVALNPAFERLFGVPVAEASGRLASEIFPALEPWWHDAFDRIARRGVPERIESTVAALGRWFEVFAYPRGGDRLTVLYEDVTARRHAEAALRASEARQAFLLTLSDALRPLTDPVAIQETAARLLGEHLGVDRAYYVAMDEEREVATVDREYRRGDVASVVGAHPYAAYGVTLAPLRAGRRVVVEDAEATPEIRPDDRPAYRALALRAFLNTPLLKGGRLVCAMCVVSAEPRRWTEEEGRMVEATAERTWAAVERAHAEAALRASEARYRTLVEHVRDYAIFLCDAAGVVTEWTTGAERVTGFPAAEAVGQPLARFYPPEDVAAGVPAAHLAEAAARGRGEWEGWRMCRDGTRFWANEIATAVRDAAGALVGFTKITRDMTARRQAEEATAEAHAATEAARRAAEAASRAKSEFLAVMSHELRTPLNAIGGYAELLELGIRGPVTAQQQEDLGRIQASQRHLLGLINEVLNYARLEAGAVQYALAPVPVAEALHAAEGLLAPQARTKGLTLTVAPCDPALRVQADADKLRQVLVNLLSNAVKFTDRGGTVHVGCAALAGGTAALDVPADDVRPDDAGPGHARRSEAEDRGWVAIAVRDTGIGIPADKRVAVFEPFVQVRADLTRTAEGTGLGLAISRDLARGMGGDLTVESTLGAGSTFVLTLPAAT